MDEELKGALATYGSLAGTMAATVWAAVAAFRKQQRAAMAKADTPTVQPVVVPMLPPAPAALGGGLAELNERLRAIERDQDIARLRLKYESSLEERQELRIECEQLQNALTSERRINAELRGRIDQIERELAEALVRPDDEAQTWLATRTTPLRPTPLRPPKTRRQP